VSGGFRVSGRWSFSSGCDASSWAMIAVPGSGPGTMLWLLVPRSDYEIVDTWFARLCVQAVDRLFEAGGARAIVESDPLQRFHRDAHGASHHAALAWDAAAESFGREALRP
jgi:alkylation response protein AidB-like acyl-CoA dehydrogenase